MRSHRCSRGAVVGWLLVVPLVLGLLGAPGQAAPADPADRAAAATTAGQTGPSARRADDVPPVLRRIRRLDIVASATEAERAPRGYRYFLITVDLPVDHADPTGPTFGLRLTLLHRGTDRPMVLETSGFGLWGGLYRSEVTRLVDGNQLDVEHRFFATSVPHRPDWARQLTVEQSARDIHAVVVAFRRLYDKPWVSSGASKGGMTATYHRRFFPGDVAGTVAYVSPNDVVDDHDSYASFLSDVGGPRLGWCRNRLVALQRRVLGQREWFRERLRGYARHRDLSWYLVGGLDKGLEATVLASYFTFWQYQPTSACRDLPVADEVSRERVFTYLDQRVLPWFALSDQGRFPMLPYLYQAAAELGSPRPYERRVEDLLDYPGHYTAASFVPPALQPVEHDAAAMPDIDRWVRSSGRRILFVDGGRDPWSAEHFSCGADGGQRGCHRLVDRGGNHGAFVGSLDRDDRRLAERLIRQWAGLGGRRTTAPAAAPVAGLDDPWLAWVRSGRREPFNLS